MTDVHAPKESSGQPELRGTVGFTKVTGSVKVPGGGSVPIVEQLTEGIEVPVTVDEESAR